MRNVNNLSVMVIGTYKHSRMIALPNDEMMRNIGLKVYRVFHNNLASYLTNGNCTILFNCYNFIKDYKRSIGKQNQILGIFNEFFDLDNLVSLTEKHNWHFLIGKVNPNSTNKPVVQKFSNLYGICMGRSTGVTQLDDGGNYCNNIANDKISVCN